MAIRTSDSLVQGIIDVDSGTDLTPFISAANSIVTQCCTDLVTDYTAANLIEIETWLAAHFYAIKESKAKSEKAGSVSVTYQSKVDLGFSLTHYGQMAMALDWYGGLAVLNGQIKNGGVSGVGVTWLGTEDE